MNGVRVAVHQSSSRSERRKLVSITRSPSVAVVSEIAPMWMTASSLRPSSQREQVGRRHDVGDLALGRLRHLPSVAEHVVDGDVGAPGLVEARDHVRADESGPAGDQKHHAALLPQPSRPPLLPQTARWRNLRHGCGKAGGTGHVRLTPPRAAEPQSMRSRSTR